MSWIQLSCRVTLSSSFTPSSAIPCKFTRVAVQRSPAIPLLKP